LLRFARNDERDSTSHHYALDGVAAAALQFLIPLGRAQPHAIAAAILQRVFRRAMT
jgi:hypothetical protein